MAGHSYVTKVASKYKDFPTQEGGYAYRPEQLVNGGYAYGPGQVVNGGYAYGPGHLVNWYVVETTVERVRAPASGYTKFGGAPLRNKHHKENMFKYASKDRHEGYEPSYESDYENSSPPRYQEDENFMANFLNTLQIGARPPTKYRPTSPNKYCPTVPNKYRPTSPNKFRPSSPNMYRPTSPNKYRPTSPNKYRPTSPNKYRPTSPNKYRPTSPNKYCPTSPSKYHPTSPIKYRPTSPNKYRPKSPNKYLPTSLVKYRSTSPDKHRPTSPSKHRPTSSTHSYPSKEAHIVKAQTLPEPDKYRPTSPIKYRPTSPTKYRPTSPTHNYPSKEELPNPNKYHPTSLVRNFPLKEGQPIRTQSSLGPNKNHSSTMGEGGQDIRVIDFSSPNYHHQSAVPPTTRHPLKTPTNNINEALGFLMESTNYSPQFDPKREGAFDNFPRAQPIEHEMPYTRPVFRGVTNPTYLRSNTIDSEEAIRRYNGAYVP
ncbi:hypothetical protein L1987_61948 [Smallanthus sonchifolius]|uniref:Uncharacterized protein n=1 Tax=Smallanthus sonchifolius TaxID=185202 RepID=A0ACB9C906_9ASTR|nr:hypothetical protein L1987_61948 [Smallanthus sonchifolius]